jgi:hypothetical protein
VDLKTILVRILFVPIYLAAITLSATDHINVLVVKDWTPADNSGPDVDFHAAKKQLSEGAFDARAERLLEASERFSQTIFNFPTLRLEKAITY